MARGLPASRPIVCAVLATVAVAQAAPGPRLPPPSTVAEPGAGTEDAPAPRRPVAVIDLTADPAAQTLANELYNALVNHADLRPITGAFIRSLQGPFADEEGRYFDTARRAKQEADDFLAQLDFRSAEVASERGTQALLNVRPSPEALGLYAELVFDGGQAALGQRRPNDANLAFGLSFRLDPAKRPDPTRYAPEIVEAYQLATTKAPVPTRLEVTGTGTVWIDGIDRGAPGTFDVAEGMHLVQLSGPERETRGRQVIVPQTSSIAIEAAPASEERKVERARSELASTRDAAARAGAVKKLARLLGVGDAVIIQKGEGGALLVQTWRDREPGFSALVEHQSESPVELLTPLAPPRPRERPRPPDDVIPLPPPVEDKPLYRKRWFQGAVAAGVIAVATTIYLVSTQQHDINFGTGDVKPVGE